MYIQSKGFNDDGDGGGYMTKVNGDDDDDINKKETKNLAVALYKSHTWSCGE